MKQFLLLQLIVFSFLARSVSFASAQDGYSPYIKLPQWSPGNFTDTMQYKIAQSGLGFHIFWSFQDVEGDYVCDSFYKGSFPTEFATLTSSGFLTDTIKYWDRNGVPYAYEYMQLKLLGRMLNLAQSNAATKSITIGDSTKLLATSPHFAFVTPKSTATTSADFTFSMTAGYELHSVFIGSVAGSRSVRIGTSAGGSDILTATALTAGNTYSFTIDKIFGSTTTLYVSDPTASTQSINFIARILK